MARGSEKWPAGYHLARAIHALDRAMALLEGVRPEDPLDASSLTQEVSDALDEVHLARQAVDA